MWAAFFYFHQSAPWLASFTTTLVCHCLGTLLPVAFCEIFVLNLAARPPSLRPPHFWFWIAFTNATVVVSAVGAAFALPSLLVVDAVLPGFSRTALHLLSLSFVADFFLYVAHRSLHAVPVLWKQVHSLHHRITAPSALSVMYIHPLDVLLQQSLPLLLAAAAVRPHLASWCLFVVLHLAETVLNHAGLFPRRGDAGGASAGALAAGEWALGLALFRWLPGRAGARHHDAHHARSNYAGDAKNLAENWLVFDWLGGTLAAY